MISYTTELASKCTVITSNFVKQILSYIVLVQYQTFISLTVIWPQKILYYGAGNLYSYALSVSPYIQCFRINI